MNLDQDIGAKLLTIVLVAFLICPFWLGDKSKDKESSRPNSIADKVYKYFLIISLSILALVGIIVTAVRYF